MTRYFSGGKARAIVYITLAYLSISLMSVFVKVSSQTLPSTEVLFARFFIGLIFVIPFIVADKAFSFKVTRVRFSLLRNLSGLASMLLMFYSLKHISVSSSMLLMNTASIFVPLLMFLLFGRRTQWRVVACTLAGFVGVFIIISPAHSAVSSFYLILGLAAAIFAAFAYIGIKELSKDDSALNITFYFYLMSSILVPLFMGYGWRLPSWYEVFLLSLVGGLGLAFQICMTLALKHAPITRITPFIFTGIIFSTLLDWAIWSVTPSLSFWIGSLFIIGSVTTVAAMQDRQAQPVSTPGREPAVR
ncbi:DMT family transporter [Dongshaea marina]|uniref:DMT family transporter n=1 Tax=Dongshaea marina TaxID=2047966 RepID=UPI000D3E8288|nr:DMT family transporter [Dongshaea marina]